MDGMQGFVCCCINEAYLSHASCTDVAFLSRDWWVRYRCLVVVLSALGNIFRLSTSGNVYLAKPRWSYSLLARQSARDHPHDTVVRRGLWRAHSGVAE